MLLLVAASMLVQGATAYAPRVLIETSPRCRSTLDGVAVTETQLLRRLTALAPHDPDVHFKPDRRTRYGCAMRVLRIIQQSGVRTKQAYVQGVTIDNGAKK